MEESLGHITAISSVTMESGKLIGNSLKTIYSRITTLKDAQDAIEGVGVGIRDQAGDIRDTQDILSDLANSWSDLTNEEKQNIGIKAAGRFQLSRFLALMNNWQVATDATQHALSSQGSAMRENEEYMGSYEARINILKNSFTELALSVGDAVLSDAMMGVIDLLTSLANIAVTVVDKFGALPIVAGVIGSVMGAMGMFKGVSGEVTSALSLMVEGFRNTSTVGMGAFEGGMYRIREAMSAFSVATPSFSKGIAGIGSALLTVGGTAVAGFAFAMIGKAVETMIAKRQEMKRLEEELQKSNDKLVDSFRNTSGGLEELVKTHANLRLKVDTGEIQEGTTEYNEYLRVNQEVADAMPNMVKFIDSKGQAHLREAYAIKENVKYAEELSREYAKLTLKEFDDEVSDKIGSIEDAHKKLEGLRRRMDNAIETINRANSGEDYTYTMPGGREVVGMSAEDIDVEMYEKNLQRSKVEALILQQEVQNGIQGINGLIGDTVLASLEANQLLGYMTDTSISATEKILTNNESFLRDIAMNEEMTSKEREKLLDEKINEMFTVGESVGIMIANKSKEITESITDPQQLEEVQRNFDLLLSILPEQFYELENLGSSGLNIFQESLEGVLSVSDKIKAGEGGLDGLIDELVALKIPQEEAERMAIQLGYAFDNQGIRAEALAKDEMGELNESLDSYIEKTIEAIDVGEAMFGYSNQETSALRSHLEHLLVMRQMGYESTEQWKEAVSGIAMYFDKTDEYVEKNIDKFAELSLLMKDWKPEFDDENPTILTEESEKAFKQIMELAEGVDVEIRINQDMEMSLPTEEIEDMTEAKEKDSEKTKQNTEKVEENTEKVKDNVEANKERKVSIEETEGAYQRMHAIDERFRDSLEEIVVSEYISQLKIDLVDIGDEILIVEDEFGNLKMTTKDGSENTYLNNISETLDGLGIKVEVVEDNVGGLKLALSDGGDTYLIDNINTGLDDAGIKLDNTVEGFRDINELDISPTLDVDFENMSEGLGGLLADFDSVDFAFQVLSQNIKDLLNIQDALNSLANFANDMRDAFAGLFSDSKGSLDELTNKANEAEGAIGDLEKAIKDVKNLASRIDTGGLEDLEKSCKDAKKSAKGLAEQLANVSEDSVTIAGRIKSSTDEMDRYIRSHNEDVEDLGNSYDDLSSDVKSAFNDMDKSVKTNTDNMNSRHAGQTGFINELAKSARNAKTDIQNLNSSAGRSMSTLSEYINQANKAVSAGKKVPSGRGGIFGGLFGSRSGEGSSEGVSSVMSAFSASIGAGESSGVSGGSGTSGTVRPSIYAGGINLDGGYDFMAFKDERADLFKVNTRERQATAYQHSISMIETKMRSITENTLKYRNALKQVISESQKLISVQKKDLSQTKNRQKAIEKQLKSLGNTSKHTEKQRDKYNKLQQEYESNISKIQSLESSIENSTQSIKDKSTEIFVDWVDQIVGRYDSAIQTVKDKASDIKFEMDVMSIIDPDNIKKELDLQAKLANQLQRQEATSKNMVNTLQKEYDKAVKKYGKSSKEAQKVKAELDTSRDALNNITLEVLRAEKDILDTRGKVADRGIEQLKSYYNSMKSMSLEAIEIEKRELEKAHKSKMEMYDEEIAKINSVYDEKLKSMDKEKKDADYQEKIDAQNLKRTELMNKISLLSRDTSIEGRKRLGDLKSELADVDKELRNMMRDRQDELLREAIEQQKQEQISKIEASKEAEEESYNNRVVDLDKEKDQITTHYDEILNTERYWAEARGDFIKGSFSTLTKELEDMNSQLARLTSGNFDNLTMNFAGFTKEIKKEFADMFAIDLDNLNFNFDGMLGDVRDVQRAKYNAYMGSGNSYSNPSLTTSSTAKKPTTSSGSSSTQAKPKPAPAPRYHTVKKGDTLWDLAEKFYGNPYDWSRIASANSSPDPRKLQIGRKLLIPFRSGGYTGDWAGDDGKVALLHKKEQVFKEQDTDNLLDASKILRALASKLPKIKSGSITDKLATAGNITNITYGDINVKVENGDKKKAKDVATEIIKGIKKKGK